MMIRLIAIIVIASIVAVVPAIHAQVPPLESTTTTPSITGEEEELTVTGKVTIPITESTQIIIDLPISPDSEIQIVPIE